MTFTTRGTLYHAWYCDECVRGCCRGHRKEMLYLTIFHRKMVRATCLTDMISTMPVGSKCAYSGLVYERGCDPVAWDKMSDAERHEWKQQTIHSTLFTALN